MAGAAGSSGACGALSALPSAAGAERPEPPHCSLGCRGARLRSSRGLLRPGGVQLVQEAGPKTFLFLSFLVVIIRIHIKRQ